MAQATAPAKGNYGDSDAARSVVMAALGTPEDSVEPEGDESDTNAETDEAASEDDDSGQDADESEDSNADEGIQSDDESEEDSEVEEEETAAEDLTAKFSKADRAAIEKSPELKRLAKGLNQSFTKSKQEFGEARRFLEALKANPKDVISRLAEANGIKLADAAPAKPAAAPETNSDAVQATVAAEEARWAAVVGPSHAKELMESVRRIAAAASGAAIAPVIQSSEQQRIQEAHNRAAADFKKFVDETPDWQKHEQAMQALAQKLGLAPGMDAYEYSKLLYDTVTRGTQVAKAKVEGAKKIVEKAKKAAAVAEPKPKPLASRTVKVAPKKGMTDDEAVRASLAEMGFDLS